MTDFGDHVALTLALVGAFLLLVSQSLDLIFHLVQNNNGCRVACHCTQWAEHMEADYNHPETYAPKMRALATQSVLYVMGWSLIIYVMVGRAKDLAEIDHMDETDLITWAILSSAGAMLSLLLLTLVPGGVYDMNTWKIPKVMIIFKFALVWHWIGRLVMRGEDEQMYRIMIEIACIVIPLGDMWVLLTRYSPEKGYFFARLVGGVLYGGGWFMLAVCLANKF